MGRKCCVRGCRSKPPDTTLHERPNERNLLNKWLQILDPYIDHDLPGIWFICTKHFKPGDYDEHPKKPVLKKTALPSVFLTSSEPPLPKILLSKNYVHDLNINQMEIPNLNDPRHKSIMNKETYSHPILAHKSPFSQNHVSEEVLEEIGAKKQKLMVDEEAFMFVSESSINPAQYAEQSVETNIIGKEHKSVGTEVDFLNQRQLTDLQYHVKVLSMQLRRLKIKHNKTVSELNNLKHTNNEMTAEQKQLDKVKADANNLNPAAIFILDILNNYGKKKPKWSESTLRCCVAWRFQSPKGYEFPRGVFLQLPSKTRIKQYVGNFGDTNILIKQRLSLESQNLAPIERISSLIIDDMAVKEKLSYDHAEDILYGVETTEDKSLGKKPKLANKMLCFVIHGMTSKFTIPAGYFFHRQLFTKTFYELTLKILQILHDCGFIILRIVTDNHKSNVGLFKLFGKGKLQICVPHPLSSHIPLFLSFDYCHGIKNARNQYLNNDLESPEGPILSSIIKSLYHLQNSLTIKPIKFLTRQHVYPNNLEKMNVLRAVQIFSPGVTNAIKYMSTYQSLAYPEFENVTPTITYMENIYNFFLLHDVSNRTQHIHQRLEAVAPYTHLNDQRLEWLDNSFPEYINSIRGMTKETSQALTFTSKSTAACVKYLLGEKGFYYVLTRAFSSDAIEALFSHVRMLGGSQDATDVRAATYAMKRIIQSGIIKSSSSANIAHSVQYTSHCGKPESKKQIETNYSIPDNIKCSINELQHTPSPLFRSLETAPVAFVAGYIVKKIENHTKCENCLRDLFSFRQSNGLLDLIYLNDRGNLKYPSESFTSLIYKIIKACLDILPHINKINVCTQLTSLLIEPLLKNAIFQCPLHKENIIRHIILRHIIPIAVKNFCSSNNKLIKRTEITEKPLSRKILKL